MIAQFASPLVAETMDAEKIRLLLLDESLGDARFIMELLEEAEGERFELVHTECVADALSYLDKEGFQTILINLSPAGGNNAETLATMRQYQSSVPVLVIYDGKGDGRKAGMMKDVAQGYVAREHLSAALLVQAVCSAIEISRLKRELKETRWREQQEKRMRLLERLSGSPQPAVNAQYTGSEGVKDSLPDRFRDLSQRYGYLLEMALERPARNATRDISEGLRAISEELGVLKAAPRDLLDVHSETLRIKSCGSTLEKAKECADEGRLMLIEAMGYLVSYYRNYSTYAMSIISTISPEARRAQRPAALQPQHARM